MSDLVKPYDLFGLEVLKGWVDPAQKHQKTIHHHGYGRFAVDGRTIKLASGWGSSEDVGSERGSDRALTVAHAIGGTTTSFTLIWPKSSGPILRILIIMHANEQSTNAQPWEVLS